MLNRLCLFYKSQNEHIYTKSFRNSPPPFQNPIYAPDQVRKQDFEMGEGRVDLDVIKVMFNISKNIVHIQSIWDPVLAHAVHVHDTTYFLRFLFTFEWFEARSIRTSLSDHLSLNTIRAIILLLIIKSVVFINIFVPDLIF